MVGLMMSGDDHVGISLINAEGDIYTCPGSGALLKRLGWGLIHQ